MEFRQFNNGGGVTTGGITTGGVTAQMEDDRYTDQWSNLKNKLIFVLESCI